jgi:hypothetical protein
MEIARAIAVEFRAGGGPNRRAEFVQDESLAPEILSEPKQGMTLAPSGRNAATVTENPRRRSR